MTLPIDYYIKNIPPPPLKKRRPVIAPAENPAKATANPEKMPRDDYYISQIPVATPPSTIEIPPAPPIENPARATARPESMLRGNYYISQVPVAPLPPEKLDDTVRGMIEEMMALPDAGEEALITAEKAAERGIVMPEGFKVRGYGENGVTMFSIIDDLGNEYRLDGTMWGPDGEEIDYGEEEEPELTEIKDDLQALFPGSSEESIGYLVENLENTWFQDVVIKQIEKAGRNELTENLLRAMGADEAGLNEFFSLLEVNTEPKPEIVKPEPPVNPVSDTVTAGMTVPFFNIDEFERAGQEQSRDEIIAAILATVDLKTVSPDVIKELLGPISTSGFVELYYLQKGWQHPDKRTLKPSEEQAALTLEDQRLNEAADKYIEIYGTGEFLKSGGIEALSTFAWPAQLLKPEITVEDFSKVDWILTGIDTAFIVAPALKGLTSAGLKTIYQTALNAGLDRWIAKQGRMVPENFIQKWLSENPAVVEQATNNFLKRLAEKKGVQYAAEKAADDTIKDIAPKLLGEYKGTGLEKPSGETSLVPLSGLREKIGDLYDLAFKDKKFNKILHFWKVDNEEAKKIGLQIEGYTHTLDTEHIRHAYREHRDLKIEASRNQIPLTKEDFQLIPEVIKYPDKIEISKTRQKLDAIIYTKKVDGTIVCIEEIRTGRKQLEITTMWKYKH